MKEFKGINYPQQQTITHNSRQLPTTADNYPQQQTKPNGTVYYKQDKLMIY